MRTDCGAVFTDDFGDPVAQSRQDQGPVASKAKAAEFVLGSQVMVHSLKKRARINGMVCF